ncbi:MAG: iron-sulfur cluster assembly accessory protein [Cardiobacteriaceae bacterium]|nr:iron-sulfur cluster assembly accessory protein [Cardiobacteriaceae bacterium]
MIELTDAAVARVEKQLAKRGSGLGIQIGVKRSGCSGYSYDIDFLDAIEEDMRTESYGNITVAVREADLALLDGLRLDVKKEGLNEHFVFDNPKASATCGCGTSFSIS